MTYHYLLLFSVSEEEAEVAIAVLPLLLAKGATCKHKEFVEFISVSVHSSQMCNSENKNLEVNYFHDSQIQK